MVIKIFFGFVLAYTIYSLLPTIYYKYIYVEDHEEGKLTLSFDDGPNPLYTLKIKDILDANGVQAYFFQVGEKVQAYPELTKELVASGHHLGLHCYKHSNPALWGPIKTYKDMKAALDVFEAQGLRPSYYRPPHGWVNLSMIYLIKKWNLELKLWTSLPGDWKEDLAWEKIYGDLEKEKKKGGLVCLHDSNHSINSKSQAPKNTIMALEEYFKK